MTADSNRSACKTNVERALGPRRDFFARGGGGKGPIAGGCSFKRRLRIPDEAARVRLVEMLVEVDQSWCDELAAKLDHFVGRVAGDGRRDRRNAAVPAHGNVERFAR